MTYIRFLAFLCILWGSLIQTSYAGKGLSIEKIGDKISTHPKKTPIAMRGADLMDEVSRIVIDGIPKNGYQLKPENNKLHFLFSNSDWSFMKEDLNTLSMLKNVDTFTFFEDEATNTTVFTVLYNCNCQADVYKWKNEKLVIDVFPLDAVGNPTKTKSWQERQKQAMMAKKNPPANNNTPPASQAAQLPIPQQPAPAPTDLQSQLQQLLSSASGQGVVKFKQGATPPTLQETPLPEQEQDPLMGHLPTTPTPTPNPAQDILAGLKMQEIGKVQQVAPNVQLSNKNMLTPTEEESLLPGDNAAFTVGANRCYPDGAFLLPDNNPATETFYDNLTKYRSRVIGEFDRPDAENALYLAYHYISYGMGEEAINVLDNFGAPESRGAIARSMAELLTSTPPSKTSIFATAKNCSNVNGLWAAYYYYRMGNEKRAAALSDFSEAADSLATMPIVLQRHIGTALALNLVRKGSYKLAGDMIDKVAANTNQFDSSVLLVRGLIDAKNGFSARALGTLEEVMNKTMGVDQQMTGLALSELKLAINENLNERDLSTLEEVIFLKAKEFSGAQALALMGEYISRAGNFHKAFKRLAKNNYHPLDIKDPVQIKSEQLFRRLAVSGEGVNNPDNLKVYYEFPDLIPDDPVLHLAFSKQLEKLGHLLPAYKIAVNMHKKHSNYFKEHDQSFYMGKLLYDMGRYAESVKTLNQPYQDDQEYMTLRADSMNKLKQHQEAYDLLNRFKNEKAYVRQAQYAMDAKQWDIAQKSYEKAARVSNNKEYYYQAKAAGYMGGHNYPGYASDYKEDVDVVFHQDEKQATGIEEVVSESNHLISLIEKKHKNIVPLISEDGGGSNQRGAKK